MELKIYHMYPDLLNLYGDIGNVTCLTKDASGEGIQVEVVGFSMKHEAPLIDGDLFFIGGGSDRGQNIVYTSFQYMLNQIGGIN